MSMLAAPSTVGNLNGAPETSAGTIPETLSLVGNGKPLPIASEPLFGRCSVVSLSGLHGCLLLVTERGPPPESVHKPGDNDHGQQPSQAPASLDVRTDALSTPLLSEGSPAPLLLEPSFMELPRAFGEQGSYFAHVPSPSECPS